ncbi:MAG: hypothetical protein M3R15_19590 [Acidobacteriota bacterium]|nr:hypothetical protein [Acidobacteriota bacterium]
MQATEDVPADAVPSDVEGAYLGQGRIYLLADNLPTAARVFSVLAHEAIGHAALEQMLGPQLLRELLANVRSLALINKAVRELGRIVDEWQPGLSKDNRAREIIALMAERGLYRNTALLEARNVSRVGRPAQIARCCEES